MAFVREGIGFAGQSGAVGNAVLVQTEGGTIIRSRPMGSRRRSEGQLAQDRRIEIVNLAWRELSREDAQAWRSYALERAAAEPRGSRKRMASAQSLFCGLGSKYLQLHGGRTVPARPPEGRFLGDALPVTVAGERRPSPNPALGDEILLRFTGERANREGVVTELLAQGLTCIHNLPRPKSYVSLGFMAFGRDVTLEAPLQFILDWACAVRYVEAATGRATEVIEIGSVSLLRP